MIASAFSKYLHDIFEDNSLFGFSPITEDLAKKSSCKCALVTLQPYPDLNYAYDAIEFFAMLEALRKSHSEKLYKVKIFLDDNDIFYATPPASPKDDGNYMAEFSYKWAALHAGLGFIGKNDVFVHYKYAQRVRISCLLIDSDMPVFSREIRSRCGECDLCIQACPHNFLTGCIWNINIHREDLIDYKKCAAKSKHDGDGPRYLCSHCALACTYPNVKV